MIEFDLTDDGRLDGAEIFNKGISQPLEVLVHIRKADDIQALTETLNALREENKRLKQDIFTWSMTGNRYLQALDELRDLQKICKDNHIYYPFRSLK